MSNDNPIFNPVSGDKLQNRKAAKHPTRTVYDRTLGGDVLYSYHTRRWGCTSQCSYEEWLEYARGAKVLICVPRPVSFFVPPSDEWLRARGLV